MSAVDHHRRWLLLAIVGTVQLLAPPGAIPVAQPGAAR